MKKGKMTRYQQGYEQAMQDAHRFASEWIDHRDKIAGCLYKIMIDLEARLDMHDYSKILNFEEFEGFSSVITRLGRTPFGSRSYKKLLKSIGPATESHQKNNSHHPEYYEDVSEMGFLDIIEMVCDWKAASQRRGGTFNLEKSVEIAKERFGFTEHQLWLIDEVARFLEDKRWDGKQK